MTFIIQCCMETLNSVWWNAPMRLLQTLYAVCQTLAVTLYPVYCTNGKLRSLERFEVSLSVLTLHLAKRL